MSESRSNALARTEEQNLSLYARDASWQRIWLSLESQPWQTLAVIPIGDIPALKLVQGLAAVAWHQRSTSVVIADFRSIGISSLAAARVELRKRVDRNERVLIAMAGLEQSAISTAIAREADRVILWVHLGHANRGQLKRAMDELGPHRGLATITVRTSD